MVFETFLHFSAMDESSLSMERVKCTSIVYLAALMNYSCSVRTRHLRNKYIALCIVIIYCIVLYGTY